MDSFRSFAFIAAPKPDNGVYNPAQRHPGYKHKKKHQHKQICHTTQRQLVFSAYPKGKTPDGQHRKEDQRDQFDRDMPAKAAKKLNHSN